LSESTDESLLLPAGEPDFGYEPVTNGSGWGSYLGPSRDSKDHETMHLSLHSFSPPFFAGLLSCTAALDAGQHAASVQDDVPASPAEVGEDPKAPKQLAQYPGAPFEDQKGNHWFSTVTEGLIRYDGKEFVTFTTADGLADDTVRGIVEDAHGVLWIATTGGVSRYDGTSFKTLTDYGDIPITYTFAEHGDHRDVWDVMLDRKGQLWVSTADGVFRYNSEALIPFPLPVLGVKPNYEFTPRMVYCTLEDRAGNLWFGTDGAGAVKYDGTSMVVYTAEKNGLCSDRVCAILEDKRGDFWFGTSSGGVSRFDGSVFTTHLRSEMFSPHTGWGRYMGIVEDRAGNIWFGVAAKGGGVYRFDGQDFRYFSKKEGLGDGGVASVREDRSGRVWLGSTSGVFRFDGERFVHVTQSP